MKKKKSLGQHFLRDDSICYNIAQLVECDAHSNVLEIGPGEGVLTQHLLGLPNINLQTVEKDDRLPLLLQKRFPPLRGKVLNEDVLQTDWNNFFPGKKFTVAGNFPYNISSQIVFKIIEHRERVWQMVGMFQKEVAQRIAANPSTKQYGVITVLIQLYFRAEYCFDVPPESFDPPPKVVSGVVRLVRRNDLENQVDYQRIRSVVKTAFNQRRKKLSNSLSTFDVDWSKLPENMPHLRSDHLSVEDYILVTNNIQF